VSRDDVVTVTCLVPPPAVLTPEDPVPAVAAAVLPELQGSLVFSVESTIDTYLAATRLPAYVTDKDAMFGKCPVVLNEYDAARAPALIVIDSIFVIL
jgi:hypothetical protein